MKDPTPDTLAWESLNDDQRAVLIEALTRLIAKAVIATPNEEFHHE
jgi:hypothetical protein